MVGWARGRSLYACVETVPCLLLNTTLGCDGVPGLGRQVVADTCSGGQGSSAESLCHQPDLRPATPSWVRFSVSTCAMPAVPSCGAWRSETRSHNYFGISQFVVQDLTVDL